MSTAYQSTGTTPLFSSRSVTMVGSEPTGADPKSKSSRRGVYTGGIQHVLVTGEKEDIKVKQEEKSLGYDRRRSFYTGCLSYNSCLMFLALLRERILGIRQTFWFSFKNLFCVSNESEWHNRVLLSLESLFRSQYKKVTDILEQALWRATKMAESWSTLTRLEGALSNLV